MNKFDHLNKSRTPKITIFVMSISIDGNGEFELGSCANSRFATCRILECNRTHNEQRRKQTQSQHCDKQSACHTLSMIVFVFFASLLDLALSVCNLVQPQCNAVERNTNCRSDYVLVDASFMPFVSQLDAVRHLFRSKTMSILLITFIYFDDLC